MRFGNHILCKQTSLIKMTGFSIIQKRFEGILIYAVFIGTAYLLCGSDKATSNKTRKAHEEGYNKGYQQALKDKKASKSLTLYSKKSKEIVISTKEDYKNFTRN